MANREYSSLFGPARHNLAQCTHLRHLWGCHLQGGQNKQTNKTTPTSWMPHIHVQRQDSKLGVGVMRCRNRIRAQLSQNLSLHFNRRNPFSSPTGGKDRGEWARQMLISFQYQAFVSLHHPHLRLFHSHLKHRAMHACMHPSMTSK